MVLVRVGVTQILPVEFNPTSVVALSLGRNGRNA